MSTAAAALDTPVDTLKEILELAAARGREKQLPYRGAVTPAEAWALLQAGAAKLLDVRSSAEWNLVGRVDGAVEIELKHFPTWQPNPAFLDEVKRRLDPQDVVLLLCRSAVRSHEAAKLLADNGYANCHNILEGFEGDKDTHSRRTVNGWKVRGLPWRQ
jgi:rhodanese-related sulfurtransferase